MAISQHFYRKIYPHVNAYIALNQHMASNLRSLGVRAERIHLRSNWVQDPGALPPASKIRLLFLGRLDSLKGVHLALDAWQQSHLSEHAEFLVAGSGPDEKEIERRCARLPGACFIGFLPPQKHTEVWSQVSAAIVPSIWMEGFPLSAVEAFARGRTVIASNRIAAIDEIENAGGIAVSPTVESWRHCFDSLDLQDLIARGRQCRAWYESEASPEVAARELTALYARLASTARQT